jgi:hypothetical protein
VSPAVGDGDGGVSFNDVSEGFNLVRMDVGIGVSVPMNEVGRSVMEGSPTLGEHETPKKTSNAATITCPIFN